MHLTRRLSIFASCLFSLMGCDFDQDIQDIPPSDQEIRSLIMEYVRINNPNISMHDLLIYKKHRLDDGRCYIEVEVQGVSLSNVSGVDTIRGEYRRRIYLFDKKDGAWEVLDDFSAMLGFHNELIFLDETGQSIERHWGGPRRQSRQ